MLLAGSSVQADSQSSIATLMIVTKSFGELCQCLDNASGLPDEVDWSTSMGLRGLQRYSITILQQHQ